MKELSIWVWILLICILFGGPVVYVIFIVGLLVRGYFIIRLLIDDKKQRKEYRKAEEERCRRN